VVADAVPGRAREVADALGVERVDAPEALFDAGIDGLVIAAATSAHAALVVAGVQAGLPTFCEKPVAADVDGTLAVLGKVGGSDVPVHIGFQRRFDAGYVAARAAVQSGSLGWIHTMRSITCDPAPPPAAYIATSGGFLRDCSVHDFFAAAGDVDAAAVVLTLDDDTFALVSGSRYNARGYDVRLEVLGSEDSICAGLDDKLPLRSAQAGVSFPAGVPYVGFFERFRDAYVAELTAFADLVAGQARPSCTVADALEAFYIAEACELSRAEHRPVALDEVRR